MMLRLYLSFSCIALGWSISLTSFAQEIPPIPDPLTVEQTQELQEFAQEDNGQQQARIEELGQQWFDRMVTALRRLNFDATLVQLQGDRVEPIRWLHGQDEDGIEVELLMRLNGPDYRVLRFGEQTAYYQPAANSYSLRSDVVHGMIPVAFYEPFTNIADYYRAIPVGGARVVDRDAQHIRLISRDNLRYGYSLWIDRTSGMILKSAMVNPQGDIVEQLQVTSLQFSERFPANLEELRGVPRPPLLTDINALAKPRYEARLEWLPDGFQRLRSNHHRLAVTGARADYHLFSDGLTDFSVYIAPAGDDQIKPVSMAGPESLYASVNGSFVVTVVGKLPIETAQRIAEQVRVRASNTADTSP